jgi:hypothetical protein
MRSHSIDVVLLAAISTVAAPIEAEERRMDVGLRLVIAAADGEPANDMPGAGVLAHYALNDDWTVGAALDRAEFDFEEPAQIVGIVQDPALEPVDALAEATAVRLWIERSLSDRSKPTQFFIGAGLGAASIDVPDVNAARADGSQFDIHTEVDTEILVSVIGGVRRRFGERWYGEIAVHAEQHFADWRVTDRVTGAQGSIEDYLSWGAHVAVGWRW